MSKSSLSVEVIRASDSEFVPASHEDPSQPGVLKRVIAVTEQFQAGTVRMLNWARLPRGRSFQSHYHEDMQEVFVMVKGTVVMSTRAHDGTGAEESHKLLEGDSILIPPMVIHRMSNAGNDAAEYIVFGISSGAGGNTVVVPDK